MPARRPEETAFRIVVPASEVLQRLESVSRPTLAQIDLDRDRLPAARPAHAYEIDAEAAQHTAPLEHSTHALRRFLDLQTIGFCRGENAAQEFLAGRPAQ